MPIAKFGERNAGNTDWEEVQSIEFVYELEDSFEFIGDRERTAGGNMRQDVITTKRNWRLSTRRMTKDEAYNFINYLRSNFFKVGDFWLDEFGTEANTIKAYVIAESIQVRRVSFWKNGTFHDDGKEYSLTVVEQ